MALDKNVKLCVLLLCGCVMIGFCQGNPRSFRGGIGDYFKSDGSDPSFRNPPKVPKKIWQPLPPPQAPKLTRSTCQHNMTNECRHDFRGKLNGYKIKKTCPDNETCASKCCPLGEGFDSIEEHCRAISDEFNPPTDINNSHKEGYNAPIKFHYLEGITYCFFSKIKRQVSDFKPKFYLKSNGSLFMESDRAAGPENFFEINKYCIDLFITYDNKTEYDAIICYKPHPFKMHRVLTTTCIVMTCVVVLLRVVAMACLPELRTLHGKILLAYLISFFVGMLLVVTRMFLTNGNILERQECVGLTFVIHFVMLSAFFWRNVMCYDIWWTFSGIRARSAQGSRTRFYLYCAYAFGWPTILTTLMAALETSKLPNEHVLMPKVWSSGCNGLDGYSKLIYYYGPIIILFVINMVLFTLTALKIAKIKRETKTVLKSKESRTHDQTEDVERFTLYANLFAAMLFLEVNWILDSIRILLPNAKNIFIIGDFCNVAVLLFVFVNFLCKKRTWIMIKKRYQHLWRLSPGLTTINSTNRTYSSQTSQTSQISLNQIYIIPSDQKNSAAIHDDTQSTDFIQNNSSPAETQDETQLPDFIQGRSSPAESQECNQAPHFSREKSSPAEDRDNTQSLDFIQGKSSPAENQEYNQSPDSSRENSSPVEIHDDSQSPDFSQEKSTPAEIQDDTQSLDLSREKSSLSEIHDGTQSPDFSREKSTPGKIQGDTKSPEFNREKSIPTEIQDATLSLDFIQGKSSQEYNQSPDTSREKSSPAETQDDTQSLNFIQCKSSPAESQNYNQLPALSREKSKPADIQDDTELPDTTREQSRPPEIQDNSQLPDLNREKSTSAEIQDDTQLPDSSRDNLSQANIQDDTQSPDFSPEKSRQANIQDDTQSPNFNRLKIITEEETGDPRSPKITVEAKQSMLIAKNTLYQPTSVEKNQTLQRSMTALDDITAVEKRRSFHDSSIDTDGGGTFQVFKGSR